MILRTQTGVGSPEKFHKYHISILNNFMLNFLLAISFSSNSLFLIFFRLFSLFLYLLFLLVFFNSLVLFRCLLTFQFPSIFFLGYFLSHIDHLKLVYLHFQRSYPFFDRTHIFPLDQIHSGTDPFHHI